MTDILHRASRDPDRTLRYAPGETGVLDVYEPAGSATELVLLIHGGFWRNAYDRMHLRPLAAALADAGMLVALPEYRRVGDEGGGWPGTLDDVCSLARRSRTLLNAPKVRLTLVGHSAGGHLAVLAGSEPGVDRVVSFAGVLDLDAAVRDNLSQGAALELLAGDEALVAVADPMQLPVPDCDLTLLHGEDDREVPVRYSALYAARDARITFERLPGGHYELIDPEAAQFEALLQVLR